MGGIEERRREEREGKEKRGERKGETYEMREGVEDDIDWGLYLMEATAGPCLLTVGNTRCR